MRIRRRWRNGLEILATFREKIEINNLKSVFILLAFPIHVWTIVQDLRQVPSWTLHMSAWELTSTVAYTLTFALIETILVFLPFLIAGLLVPERWSDRFTAVSGVLIGLMTYLAIFIQLMITIGLFVRFFLVISALLLILGGWLATRFPIAAQVTTGLATRLSVLTALYLGLDLIGVVIVISRNL